MDFYPNCVFKGRDSIQDKLILNKANVLSTLANNPGLSCIGVIKNINDVAF